VCGCRKPGNDAKPNVDKKRAGNGQATQEVVETVANQDQICQWLPTVRMCSMAVMSME
jgi:hypothetical protein